MNSAIVTTKEEESLINSIVQRAMNLGIQYEFPSFTSDRLSLLLDLQGVHYKCCPLRLEDLFLADDHDFCKDVIGIIINFDRVNERFKNDYLPVYAQCW